MNGGEIHEYIIDRLDAEFQAKGFRTAKQVPARSGGRIDYVDLVAEDDSGRFICVEVEMSPKRVADDIVKATRLSRYALRRGQDNDRCELWIVVANRRVKEAIRRRLKQLAVNEGDMILLLTYGQAVARVRGRFSFSSEAMSEEKANREEYHGPPKALGRLAGDPKMTEHQQRENRPTKNGIIDSLALMPEKTLLDESCLAALHVSPRTIRRMVARLELPPPVQLKP